MKGEERTPPGACRAHLRVRPSEPDPLNRGLRLVKLRFELPRGAYATLVVKRLLARSGAEAGRARGRPPRRTPRAARRTRPARSAAVRRAAARRRGRLARNPTNERTHQEHQVHEREHDRRRDRRIGLYQMEGLTDVSEETLSTPFGAPSDSYLTGRLGDVRMVFLPRHGRGHRIPPSAINFRANIWGMKKLGVDRHAVGLRRRFHEARRSSPGAPRPRSDQFIDRTKHRVEVHVLRGRTSSPTCRSRTPSVRALRKVRRSTAAPARSTPTSTMGGT